MSASTLLHSLFRYKAWANTNLFAQLATLDPEAYQAERHSAIRILNHVYVVDRIFAARLSGTAHGYSENNTPETPALDALCAAVAASDQWYLDYIAALHPAQLTEPVEFVFTDGQNGRMTREEILAHVATHGGFHRGGVGRITAPLPVEPVRDIFTAYLHQAEPARRERH